MDCANRCVRAAGMTFCFPASRAESRAREVDAVRRGSAAASYLFDVDHRSPSFISPPNFDCPCQVLNYRALHWPRPTGAEQTVTRARLKWGKPRGRFTPCCGSPRPYLEGSSPSHQWALVQLSARNARRSSMPGGGSVSRMIWCVDQQQTVQCQRPPPPTPRFSFDGEGLPYQTAGLASVPPR